MKTLSNILILVSLSSFSQSKVDTVCLQSTTKLEEVVIFGENKSKVTKLGFLNKENFTLSIYKDYEIGVFISNKEEFKKITDIYLKINNELSSTCEIVLSFYEFENEPTTLITSMKALIEPTRKKKQIISTKILDVNFPRKGIFISTKILSNVVKEDNSHLRIFLTENYNTEASFIRGAIYGEEWIPLSKLNIGESRQINACFGFFATK